MPQVPQGSQPDMLMPDMGPQPDPSYDPNAIYADQMREERVSNILQQINPDNLVVDIEYRIKGYKKDPFTKEWSAPEKGLKISEILVANFMSFLGSILNQNTSMSNYSNTEINSITENIIDYVADDLDVNAEKYGIEGDYQEMSRIGNIIIMTVFTVLKRAQNGMEARRVFSALKINETLTQQPKAPGVMDALKFWK